MRPVPSHGVLDVQLAHPPRRSVLPSVRHTARYPGCRDGCKLPLVPRCAAQRTCCPMRAQAIRLATQQAARCHAGRLASSAHVHDRASCVGDGSRRPWCPNNPADRLCRAGCAIENGGGYAGENGGGYGGR